MENIILNIDTKFRNKSVYPNPGSFSYRFKDPLKNISNIRLSSIELPTVFYTFSQAYNNLTFKIIYNSEEYMINISEGNYDAFGLISAIQSLLNQLNGEIGTNFKISFSETTGRVTIICDYSFTLIFDNDNLHYSLGGRLGFTLDNNSYLNINQQTKFDQTLNHNVYYWTGETFLNVVGDQYLFVRVNDYGVIYNDVCTNTLLAKVIVYSNGIIFDNGSNFITKSFEFKQPTNISKLDIDLVNSYGHIIDTNLLNYSLTFEFGQIYDKHSYNKHNFQIN